MRIRRIKVNSDLLLRALRGTMLDPARFYRIDGIPEDAVVRSVYMERPDVINYVIESAEFDDVSEGKEIPEQFISVTELTVLATDILNKG